VARVVELLARRPQLQERLTGQIADALMKSSPLERHFRDGAVAPVQFPPRDFCLSTLGMFELGLEPKDVLPPLKTDTGAGPVVR
jgi:hypothetical protein